MCVHCWKQRMPDRVSSLLDVTPDIRDTYETNLFLTGLYLFGEGSLSPQLHWLLPVQSSSLRGREGGNKRRRR